MAHHQGPDMAVPGLTVVPTEWMAGLDETVSWLVDTQESGSNPTRIACITAPSRARTTAVVPTAIARALVDAAKSTLFVHVTGAEQVDSTRAWFDHLARQNSSTASPGRMAADRIGIMSYLRLATNLRNGQDFVDGLRRAQPSHWVEGIRNSAVRELVFTVDVDPTWPAEFCLGLMVLLAWAKYMVKSPETPIRAVGIILLSATHPDSTMKALLNAAENKAGWAVSCCVLPEATRHIRKPRIVSTSSDKLRPLVRAIIADALETERHCIIYFEPWSPDLDLKGLNVDVVRKKQQWVDLVTTGRLFDRLAKMGPHRHAVFLFQQGTRAPSVGIRGFTHVHVMPSIGPSFLKIMDGQTGHIVSANMRMSTRESLEEASWAFRVFETPDDNIAVYVCADGPEPVDHSYAVKAHNEHLPGLIMACGEYQDWLGSIANLYAPVFLPEHPSTLLAAEKLYNSNLIRRERGDTGAFVPSGASHLNWKVFYRVLQLVGYDVGLAYFLALPTTDPAVATIKVQLVALVAAGINNVFDAVTLAPNQGPTREEMFQSCWGFTSCIMKNGSLWALLAMWKYALRSSNRFRDGRDVICLLDGAIKIDARESREVVDDIDDFIRILKGPLGQGGIRFVSIDDETGVLSLESLTVLHRQLARSFVHNLVGVQAVGPQQGGTELLLFQCRASAMQLQPQMETLGSVDVARIRASEASSPASSSLGICLRYMRLGSNHMTLMEDWTWIPQSIVHGVVPAMYYSVHRAAPTSLQDVIGTSGRLYLNEHEFTAPETEDPGQVSIEVISGATQPSAGVE